MPTERRDRAASVDEMEVRARLILPLGTAARTDTKATHGEINAYVSGGQVYLQIFDRASLTWKPIQWYTKAMLGGNLV